MKFLQVVLGLAILAVILLVIAFFLPSSYTIKKTTIIQASPEKVFTQVGNIQNWPNWDPWSERDENMAYRFREQNSEGNPVYYWVTEINDYGEISVLEAQPPKKIRYTVNFPTYHLSSKGGFELQAVKKGTQVTWTDEGDFAWNPIKRFIGLFLVKMVAKDFDRGLKNLKQVCEKGEQLNGSAH